MSYVFFLCGPVLIDPQSGAGPRPRGLATSDLECLIPKHQQQLPTNSHHHS